MYLCTYDIVCVSSLFNQPSLHLSPFGLFFENIDADGPYTPESISSAFLEAKQQIVLTDGKHTFVEKHDRRYPPNKVFLSSMCFLILTFQH